MTRLPSGEWEVAMFGAVGGIELRVVYGHPVASIVLPSIYGRQSSGGGPGPHWETVFNLDASAARALAALLQLAADKAETSPPMSAKQFETLGVSPMFPLPAAHRDVPL
jgi:hypothetical protein